MFDVVFISYDEPNADPVSTNSRTEPAAIEEVKCNVSNNRGTTK